MLFPPAQLSPPPKAPAHPGLRHAVLVKSQDAEDPLSNFGSGVVVAAGIVATNAHVVQAGASVQVVQGNRSWPARTLSMDPDRDLALLEVPGLDLPAAPLAAHPPEDGDPLGYVGYPGGKGPVIRTGRLAGTWSHLQSRLLQVDIDLSPGASGGGLYNAQQELVGLATFQLRGRPHMVFALPTAWIQERIEKRESKSASPRVEPLQDRFAAQMAVEPANRSRWRAFAEAWAREAPEDPDALAALGHALTTALEALREEGSQDGAQYLQLSRESRATQEKIIALRRDRARDWHNLGAALDRENRFHEALDAHQESVRLQPDYAPGWEGLGATLFNTRKFAPARTAFLEAARLAPDAVHAWGLLAECEVSLGRFEEALGHYRIALRYRPFHAGWWEAFGRCAQASQRESDVAEALARLQGLAPDRARELGKVVRKRKR